jgi:2'-5' RNA ligase
VRLFVALEIPSAVRENLAALIRKLRAVAPQAKWVRAENLHVTLKFIGEVPETKLEAIRMALGEVRSESCVTLDFRAFSGPASRHPRTSMRSRLTSSALPKNLASRGKSGPSPRI